MKEYKQILFMEMSYYIENTEEEKVKMEEEAEEKIDDKGSRKLDECEGKIEEEESKNYEKGKEKGERIIEDRRQEDGEEEDERRRKRHELEMIVDDKLIEHYYGRYLELEEVYGIKDHNKLEQEKEELKVLIRKDKERMSTMDRIEGRETKRQNVVSFLNQSKQKKINIYHYFFFR